MKKEEFIKQLGDNYKRGIEIIRVKNSDYAGESDFYRNFRSAELVGVSVERAILVRVLDKISRISNLLDKEAKVKDEKIDDTMVDAINYLNLLLVYLQNK